MFPSNLCARMLGQLGAKIREASKLVTRMLGWLGAKSAMPCVFTKCSQQLKEKANLFVKEASKCHVIWPRNGRPMTHGIS